VALRRKTLAASASAVIQEDEAKRLATVTPEDLQRKLEAQMAEQASLQAKREAEELMKLKIPPVATKKTEVLTKTHCLRDQERSMLMAQVVRSWLNG